MSDYRWHVSKQVVERLLSVRGAKQRQNLIDFFELLASKRDFEVEDSFEDEEGNQFFVKSFNQWVITFKVDHAVKQVSIVAIES